MPIYSQSKKQFKHFLNLEIILFIHFWLSYFLKFDISVIDYFFYFINIDTLERFFKSYEINITESILLFMFLIYIVPVVSMTLTRTPIKIFANMTCMTSYSNTSALWYISSLDNTSQSTTKTQKEGGLERTISSLISITMKKDNERQVYCKANNT